MDWRTRTYCGSLDRSHAGKEVLLMGWVDAKALIMETLISIKRAGADLILTYSAIDVARELNDQ